MASATSAQATTRAATTRARYLSAFRVIASNANSLTSWRRPELPRQLNELEARWLSSQPVTMDYRPRIAELEKQRANLIAAIKSGGLASELGAELKALSSQLEQLKAMSQTKPQARRAPQESVEQRVARMLDRLAQGGEIAQGVVRELFPGGIWLSPDPDRGRFLWATARTAPRSHCRRGGKPRAVRTRMSLIAA